MRAAFLILVAFVSNAFATPAAEPVDEEVLAKLRARVGSQREVLLREVKRLGDGKIDLEIFAESEIDPAQAPIILADYPSYGAWMLPGINQSPDGSRYLTQLHGLKALSPGASVLEALYSFDVPMLHTRRVVQFKLRHQKTPKSFTVIAESDDPPGALATADGVLKVFRSERDASRSWVYARGRVHLRSWLLYEALPEKVLSRETSERLRVLMDNYLREESARRARSTSSKKRTTAS